MKEVTGTFVIIGGGIAGVSCAEQLAIEEPQSDVILISASPLVKAVVNLNQLSERLVQFDVKEESHSSLEDRYRNCRVIFSSAVSLDSEKHEIYLSDNHKVIYQALCICTGAIPKVISKDCPYVLGIRDTETVKVFQQKLVDAKRVLVVGNGGIAIELVYEIENCQVIWAIKDKSIGATFFDAGAAHFFIPCLKEEKRQEEEPVPCKRLKYGLEGCSQSTVGSALGPDWASTVCMKGKKEEKRNVHVEYECEVAAIYLKDEFLAKGLKETIFESEVIWPVYVQLTNGTIVGCDFVTSATGVIPNSSVLLSDKEFKLAEDGGILVDDQMKTNIESVFAAGDVCTASWDLSEHWFQMRLWTQARQMGAYAAKCMSAYLRGEKMVLDICFDLFTHVTRFFGYKVVLLGLFNGQKLGADYEIIMRVTESKEYVKVVMKQGRMQGAILIGETDLEETFENLILNQLDLSSYGEDILNPNVDIEDYFD